jgi:hypothetical protein
VLPGFGSASRTLRRLSRRSCAAMKADHRAREAAHG